MHVAVLVEFALVACGSHETSPPPPSQLQQPVLRNAKPTAPPPADALSAPADAPPSAMDASPSSSEARSGAADARAQNGRFDIAGVVLHFAVPDGWARNRGLRAPIDGAMSSALTDLDRALMDFLRAVWLGELLIATGKEVEVFPAELDPVTTAFFAIFRPIVQA
jgi:hypothetical protein